MKPTDLAALLQECYRERLAMFDRHKAVATHVTDYDFNNAYQYIVNREETHLQWLAGAIEELGRLAARRRPHGRDCQGALERRPDRTLAAEDARAGQAFVDNVEAARGVAQPRAQPDDAAVMLGEVQEQSGSSSRPPPASKTCSAANGRRPRQARRRLALPLGRRLTRLAFRSPSRSAATWAIARRTLVAALDALRPLIPALRASTFHDTAPVGVPSHNLAI